MVRQVKLRNRNYWAWFAKEPVGNKHGHWSEYVMHATAIACNVTFVIGSSFFFSAVPEAWGPKAGATCFLVASIIMMITSVIGSLEHLAYLRTAPAARKEWADLTDREASKLYLESRELLEEACYFLGSTAYAVGSVWYEPAFTAAVTHAPKGKQVWEQWAAALFILGSAFHILAAYQNALAIAHEGLFTHEAHRGAARRFI